MTPGPGAGGVAVESQEDPFGKMGECGQPAGRDERRHGQGPPRQPRHRRSPGDAPHRAGESHPGAPDSAALSSVTRGVRANGRGEYMIASPAGSRCRSAPQARKREQPTFAQAPRSQERCASSARPPTRMPRPSSHPHATCQCRRTCPQVHACISARTVMSTSGRAGFRRCARRAISGSMAYSFSWLRSRRRKRPSASGGKTTRK
jgi:hypothetical protein